MTFVPILIFTVLHHPGLERFRRRRRRQLAGIGNEAVRNQMRAPLMLAALLPKGLLGAFAALMLGAFISTHTTYMHSWSSIFVQDVVLPFRERPRSPRRPPALLRLAVVAGVALFTFVFSLFYKQSQAILLFFALTGAIFAGWSGAVIIGGLYTRWGTTAAAWAAGLTGVTLTLTGFVLEQAQRTWRETASPSGTCWTGPAPSAPPCGRPGSTRTCPTASSSGAWSMWVCVVVYLAVSGLQQLIRRRDFDLDRLLHRGPYELDGEIEAGTVATGRGWRTLGVTAEFGRRDKFLYLLTWSWNIAWVLVFIAATVFFLTRRVENGDWSRWNPLWLEFWQTKMWIELSVAVVVIFWFTYGGVRDVRQLLRDLRERKRDDSDDGFVGE